MSLICDPSSVISPLPPILVEPVHSRYLNFFEIVTSRQYMGVPHNIIKKIKPHKISIDFPTVKVPHKIIKMISWDPPSPDQVKINTDAAFKSSRGLASAGGLIRDCNGVWCTGFPMHLGGSITSLQAELMGIWGGLNLAWNRGFRNVILESDCKVAVDLVLRNGDSDDHLVRTIKELLGRKWTVKIQHHYREGNQAADWLANLGIQLSSHDYFEFLLRL